MMNKRIQNEGNEYAVITHSRTHVSFCGIGKNGSFSGSEPLKEQSRQAAMLRIYEIFKKHGVSEYEVLGPRSGSKGRP